MNNSICILAAYFGKFPNYFYLFLKTCEYNSRIDFLIFSDATVSSKLPSNVKIIPFTLGEMKKLADEKMQMNVALNHAYKCCDFKPVYGVIFSDYIKQYEYWGHCDFDLIFGDIYSFLVKYDYKAYDKFLPLGHLCFYKNTETVKNYYKLPGSQKGNYKEVYSSDLSYAFDELGGMVEIYNYNNLPMFTGRLFADITHEYRRLRLSEHCHIGDKDKNYPYQVFYWKDGKTYRTYFHDGKSYTEEFMYIHFKKRPNFEVMFNIDTVKAFYITNKGFIPMTDDSISIDTVQKYNHYYGQGYELLEHAFFQMKNYKVRLKSRIDRKKYEKQQRNR